MLKNLRSMLVRLLARCGFALRRLSEEDRRYYLSSYDQSRALPQGAEAALDAEHPALISLRERYRSLDLPVLPSHIWQGRHLNRNLQLARFRGDNVYVWQYRQLRSEARMKTYLTLMDIESRDVLGLLDRLGEDGLFGCWTFEYGHRGALSRDLLDSVNEINFLESEIGLSRLARFSVLDIGAGYGRLAHRMHAAMPNLEAYDCVDAVPESTFLCDYYLSYRELTDKARAVPLDQLDGLRPPGSYDLAVNIHSFSECPIAAIRWWLQKVAELQVKWLLIVPNDPNEMLSTEGEGPRVDFMPDIKAAGYELVTSRPVYANDELRALIGVSDHFFLFRRRDA